MRLYPPALAMLFLKVFPMVILARLTVILKTILNLRKFYLLANVFTLFFPCIYLTKVGAWLSGKLTKTLSIFFCKMAHRIYIKLHLLKWAETLKLRWTYDALLTDYKDFFLSFRYYIKYTSKSNPRI